MFILKNMVDPCGKEIYKLNDIKDIGDIVTAIDNEKEAKKAMLAASDMCFGGIYTSRKIRLECVREPKDSISL